MPCNGNVLPVLCNFRWPSGQYSCNAGPELTLAHIGIDLGTTNSLIAQFTENGPELISNRLGGVLTPSVVHVDRGHVHTGETAKARLLTRPDQTVAAFKRTMGTEKAYRLDGKTMTSVELSAAVLRALKEDAETALEEPVVDVVISVPAYFNEAQRKSVAQAARMADLNPVRLINEPTAAALAYGLQDLSQESCFLVFDLGGGTFDVSILEVFEGVMEVKATAGDAYLGGEDFTRTLVHHLTGLASFKRLDGEDEAALRKAAEDIKLALTHRDTASIEIRREELTLSATITRAQFEEMCAPLLTRLRRPVERVLYDAKLRPEDLQKVVLVGGATRMPMVRSLIARHLRHFPDGHIDPDHAVALGAAVQAGLVGKNQALRDVVMTDVTAHSLGVNTTKEIGNRFMTGYFLPIIERNTVVPVSREELLQTLRPDQTALELEIYQGESPDVTANVRLGVLKVPVPRSRDGSLQQASVRFSYDVSGLLEVDVITLGDGKRTSTTIRNLAGDMSDEEIEKARKSLEKLKIHPRDEEVNIALRARIEQCSAMAREIDREIFTALLVEFDVLLARQSTAEIAAFREAAEASMKRFEDSYVF